MKRMVFTLDLYTKIILTVIAVALSGLFLQLSFASKEASAKNECAQVDIARIGGKTVGYGGPIFVKSE